MGDDDKAKGSDGKAKAGGGLKAVKHQCKCKCEKEKVIRGILIGIAVFLFVILLTVFIIWLVLRPTKPRFFLQDATVLQFNLSQSSEPYSLSSTLQVTVSSRNPNNRIGIYYDTLNIYAVYKSQQITLESSIQPYYQGHKDVSIWSPLLLGISIPISPYICASLGRDESAGLLLLNVRIDGRVRWKVGSWTSGKYHIHVTCPAFLTFSGGNNGYSPVIRFQQMTGCTVEV